MKKKNILRWEFEITRSRSVKNRNRQKHKYWAQFTLGIILGLILGLVMESNILETKKISANDSFCKFSMERNLLSASKMNSHSYFNEDPLKTIKLRKFDGSHSLQESLVFVGVMTAQKYLGTRAVAVYETWGRELTGRIGFFSSESSTVPENCKDLPLIRLRKVDDSYPPQKKSFMMLQYMWENYGNRFEWFVRADDDVYIRPDKLEDFLRSIDSKKPLFIGQAGRGNQEEFGLLSLEYDENFCMGGPGIIISRETLSRIAPHIKYCLKNLYTTHEDVELGRCVRKFADVSCTWSYEMQTILYHNSSGHEAFTGNLKQKEVNRAITLHPVKQYQYMYRLHNYMKYLRIQDLQHEITMMQRDIKEVLDLIVNSKIHTDEKNEVYYKPEEKKYLRFLDIFAQEPSIQKFRPKSEEELLSWDFIQRSMYSKGNLNPRRRIEASFKEGLEDVIREFMEMINQFSRQRGRVIEYQDLLYGYSRLDPLHGADYILDMLLKYKKYRGRKMTVPVRRHAYLQQQFTGIEIRDITNKKHYNEGYERTSQTKSNDLKHLIKDSLVKLKQEFSPLAFPFLAEIEDRKKVINFILPLSGRYGTFLRFMENYEEICLSNDDYTALVVVLFRNTKESNSEKIMEHFENFKRKYPKAALQLIPVDDEFARAIALEIGAAACSDDENNILFFIDVDIVFGTDTLERIRRNTLRGRQVYFPIVYSEFDPTLVYGNHNISSSPNHFLINSDTGYWRQFGFGVASIFKKDLRRVGGLDTSIRGWGKEDVDLFEKFLSSGNITIFRTVDPTLIHVFHIVDCDPNLEITQLKMCKGTRKDTYGNVNQLADCIYKRPINFTLAINKEKDI